MTAAALIAAGAAASAAPPAGPPRDGRLREPSAARARYLMGTLCEAEARGEGAGAAIDAAFDEIARLERVLSDYQPDSELSRLNAAAGSGPVACSADLLGFVREASRFSSLTAGAFDITVGALIDVWDLRGRGRLASPAGIETALSRTGWRRVRLDEEAGTIALPAGMKLDPGALGKGYALDAAGRILTSRGIRAALIDFGGQFLAIGPPPDEPAWEVSVAHPLRRDEAALTLRLRDASISTSGNSERRIEVQGRPLGHIVDPRTGLTVDRTASATVIARTGAEADACSTALLVMGPESGLGWAERHAGIAALFLTIDEAGRLRADATRTLQTYVPSGPAPDGADSTKGSR